MSGKGGAGKGGSGAGARQGGQQSPTFVLSAAPAALLLAMSVAVAAEGLAGGYSSAAIFATAGAGSALVGAAPRAFAPRRGLGNGSASTSREVRHCATRPCRQASGSSMGPRRPCPLPTRTPHPSPSPRLGRRGRRPARTHCCGAGVSRHCASRRDSSFQGPAPGGGVEAPPGCPGLRASCGCTFYHSEMRFFFPTAQALKNHLTQLAFLRGGNESLTQGLISLFVYSFFNRAQSQGQYTCYVGISFSVMSLDLMCHRVTSNFLHRPSFLS